MSLPLLPPFPRPDLTARVQATLVARPSCVIHGPRGSGKSTFLVVDLLPRLRGTGWPVCFAELGGDVGPARALVDALEQEAGRRGVPLPYQRPGVAVPPLDLRLQSVVDALVHAGPAPLLLVIDDAHRLAEPPQRAVAGVLSAALARHEGTLLAVFTASSWTPPALLGAHPIALPELDDAFLAHRARLFEGMTGRSVDVEALGRVFRRVCAFPAYLDRILLHMVAAQTSDPDLGFADWLSAAGRARLHPIWLSLPPLDQVVLEHLALAACGDGGQVSLFGGAFASLASRQPGVVGPVTPAKIQTAVKRLIRSGLVASLEEPGAYVIEDRALALHIDHLHRTGHCSCGREQTGSLWG